MEKRTPQEVLKFARDQKARVLDLKFVDLPGTWQHFSLPIGSLEDGSFEDGFGFDGSSIRGWKHINESDMIVVPDPNTAFIDPFMKEPTLSLICNIFDPITKEKYPRDPRGIAIKAGGLREEHLASRPTSSSVPKRNSSSSTTCVSTRSRRVRSITSTSAEGGWNSGSDDGPNLGYKLRFKEGYFPVAPSTRCRTSQRDDARDHGSRHRRGSAAPRSGHGRVSAKSTSSSTRSRAWRIVS
jgi:glutamine synthetase